MFDGLNLQPYTLGRGSKRPFVPAGQVMGGKIESLNVCERDPAAVGDCHDEPAAGTHHFGCAAQQLPRPRHMLQDMEYDRSIKLLFGRKCRCFEISLTDLEPLGSEELEGGTVAVEAHGAYAVCGELAKQGATTATDVNDALAGPNEFEHLVHVPSHCLVILSRAG